LNRRTGKGTSLEKQKALGVMDWQKKKPRTRRERSLKVGKGGVLREPIETWGRTELDWRAAVGGGSIPYPEKNIVTRQTAPKIPRKILGTAPGEGRTGHLSHQKKVQPRQYPF